VLAVLPKRLGKFGLQLHPDKTRLIDFRSWRSTHEKDEQTLPTTFNFLGFTHVWAKTRKGSAVVRQLTAKDRLARSLKAINQRCKRMMHWPIRAQHQRLCRALTGHYAYFGISGNSRRLGLLYYEVRRLWQKWLSRRSSKSYLLWGRFRRILERFVLPPPRIVHPYIIS
jgi:RNA-directed DNA polymerase